MTLTIMNVKSRMTLGRLWICVFGCVCGVVMSAQVPMGQNPRVTVQHVDRLANSHNPQMLYWFITSSETQSDIWKQHLQTIEDNGSFDFIFFTDRNGVDFCDTAKMKPFFTEVVRQGHAHGIKFGLQLWTKSNDAPDSALEGAVAETELKLDAKGHADFTAKTTGPSVHRHTEGLEIENFPPVRSELMAAYAFENTGDGKYAPGSLKDVSAKVKVTSAKPGMVTGTLAVETFVHDETTRLFGAQSFHGIHDT